MIDKTIAMIDALPLGDVVLESAWSSSTPIYKSTGLNSEQLQHLAAELKQLREFVGAMKVLADLAQDVCDVFCPVNEREELAYRKLREALRPYTEAK